MSQTAILSPLSPPTLEESLILELANSLSPPEGVGRLEGWDWTWREWLRAKFPHIGYSHFAPRHENLWEWFDALEPGVAPKARVENWPRGGAKSSTCEL